MRCKCKIGIAVMLFVLFLTTNVAAQVTLVRDINPFAVSSSPQNLTEVNGTLFFTADEGTSGRELWKSDGTGGNTLMLNDINPGAADSSPSELTNVNGILFFTADDGVNGRELWKSDGTAVGTVLVKDIVLGGSGSPSSLTRTTRSVCIYISQL